jgi:indolepyruvate ferredoxin oxidoreductase
MLPTQFGPKASFTYQLHPPLLRALGMKKKIGFGKWFNLIYRLLHAMRHLRHTPLDIFGYAQVRQVERSLIGEYRALITAELAGLSPSTHQRAAQLATLPDMIRGYEEIKLDNVVRFREKAREIQGDICSSPGEIGSISKIEPI